ncbi:MAG TPA: cytochrome c [Saprospiraceae bacterium]|nr:cytochrome c [Saprospiraceae bacterium]
MLKKILLGLLAIIVLVILGLFIFVQVSWDKKYDWPAPELKVSTDSTVIARGKYLVTGPAHCISCHVSGFDDMVAADTGAMVPLQGGLTFQMGPIGSLTTRNLTPDAKTGIGRYSDAQIFRMMRHGIRPDGMSSMPLIMPFWNMADEDLVAVVSYLRSLPPVEHEVADAHYTFMGKAVRTFAPTFKPIENPTPPATAPAMAPTVERGEYLVRYVCNCVGCHTQRDMMTYEATGPEFAGGMEFEPWPAFHKYLGVDTTLWIRTPNITPDPTGVLVKFKTPEEFIARFRQGRTVPYSPMDWGPFSRMSDEDLTAIYMFLNKLEPVAKDVGDISFKKPS